MLAAPPAGPGLDPAWVSAALAFAAAITGLTAWAARWAWRAARRVTHFLDAWNGQPEADGIPARPGVMARLGTLEETVTAVHAETQANHGTSLRDVVNRTEAAVAGIITEQEAVRAELAKVTKGTP